MKKYLLLVMLSLVGKLYAQDYFQQEVNYEIKVSLDDEKHFLHGSETIGYKNNSPETLDFIWFHIWPNGYKNKNTALAKQLLENKKNIMQTKDTAILGWIDSLAFSSEGQPLSWEYHPDYIDVCKVILAKPLEPGESVEISTPFRVKIPSAEISRLGHTEQAYFVSQWYPKPAVFDKTGWHEMPFLNIGEFYSEFGSFDVEITLPENYVVASTGELQTQSEIDFINKKAAETAALAFFPKENDFPASSEKIKTIRYTAENAHDFAWFADKRFNILKSKVVTPHEKNEVTTWAFFTNHKAEEWKMATSYIDTAVYSYSEKTIDYPYPQCTAIQGDLKAGGGMEYPMITIIGKDYEGPQLDEVITHEVGHNWFYGIFGFNERDYPYLDEGINTFYENRIMSRKYAVEPLADEIGLPARMSQILNAKNWPSVSMTEIEQSYLINRNMDLAPNLHSAQYDEINYGLSVYYKAAFCYGHLLNYLGEEEFDRIMKIFANEWKFKHPDMSDIRSLFEKETGKDLSWFFDDFIGSNKKTDYKISEVRKGKVRVWNATGLQCPFLLSGISGDDTTVQIWSDGFKNLKWIDFPTEKVDRIMIDADYEMPDINRRNNSIKTKGVFKKSKPFKLMFLGALGNPETSNLYYLPLLSWNATNGIMLGMYLHNDIFPYGKFEYHLAPHYAFNNNALAGFGDVSYYMHPYSNIIREVKFNVHAKQYGYEHFDKEVSSYQMMRISLNYSFVEPSRTRGVKQDLKFSFYRAGFDGNEDWHISKYVNYYDADYSLSTKSYYTPTKFHLNFNFSEEQMRLSLEVVQKIHFKSQKNPLTIRFFGGKNFIDLWGRNCIQYGSFTSESDFLFENDFMYRGLKLHDSFWKQQIELKDGGFVSYVPYNTYGEYVATLNVTSPKAHKKAPIRLYANVGYFDEFEQNKRHWLNPLITIPSFSNFDDNFHFESGVELTVIPNVLFLYFPAYLSSDLEDYNKSVTDNNYWKRIRFVFRISDSNMLMKLRGL